MPASPRPGDWIRCRQVQVPGSVATTRTRKVLLAVPEAVDALLEIGTGQVHPDGDVGVGVGEGARGGEGQFLFLPDVHWGSGG